MIDLGRTREEMLRAIKASDKAWANNLTDPADPAFVAQHEARLVVRRRTRDDVLPGLNAALGARFADVPPEHLSDNLISLLKKGLGNADKWGNRKDPTKSITVEAIVTNTGALVAISDEGPGFDVEGTLRRFRADEPYFEHGGSGFARFNKTKSLVSYADGGRTLLICFLCISQPGRIAKQTDQRALGKAADVEAMTALLAAELPYFRDNNAALRSCDIYASGEGAGDRSQIKYSLEYSQGELSRVRKVILTGRLLTELEAETDFLVARQLFNGSFNERQRIRVPKPVAVLKEPPLVLFEFNPSMTLRECLKRTADVNEAAKIFKRIGAGLLLLHQSELAVNAGGELADELERRRAIMERAVAKLARVSAQWADRAQQVFDGLGGRVTALKSYQPVPIHGAFAFDRIFWESKTFYFCGFEACRSSHPGLDVGGFLADLLRFYVIRSKGNSDFYLAGREAFFEGYLADHLPAWCEDLPFFIANALFLRLVRLIERSEAKWEAKVDALLEQSERLLA